MTWEKDIPFGSSDDVIDYLCRSLRMLDPQAPLVIHAPLTTAITQQCFIMRHSFVNFLESRIEPVAVMVSASKTTLSSS